MIHPHWGQYNRTSLGSALAGYSLPVIILLMIPHCVANVLSISCFFLFEKLSYIWSLLR